MNSIPVGHPVGSNGAVNFDAGLVPDGAARAMAEVEATPGHDSVLIGNVRDFPQAEVASQPTAVEPTVYANTIQVSLGLTLCTGYTFLRNMKELKTVDIPKRDGSTGHDRYNFYNPFVRSDKELHSGEGLLRATLASIARKAVAVLGREIVIIEDKLTASEAVSKLSKSTVDALRGIFPCRPADHLFDVGVTLSDGAVAQRPVKFSEIFAINSWTTAETDEDSGCIVHTVNVNIQLNVGALYDAKEPHVFVRRAKTFLDLQLKHHGLDTLVDYNVNYAIDSTTLESPEVRDALELLLTEDGYSLISRAAVTADRYTWIDKTDVDALFGYGCDLILQSAANVPAGQTEE